MESPLYNLAPPDLLIIETLRYDPAIGFLRLDLHLDRAALTAAKLKVGFDRQAAIAALQGATEDQDVRCRLTIDLQGGIRVSTGKYFENKKPWRIKISPQHISSTDPWRGVKTTQRRLYDSTRAALPKHIDEVIFLNETGEVCEGTITNVFAEFGDTLFTPPDSAGVLPGVLRKELLQNGAVIEKTIMITDLMKADQIYVGNSLRGLIKTKLSRR